MAVAASMGALVGLAVGVGAAAGSQAEREKTKNNKQNRTGMDNFFTTKATKFHKEKFKDHCGPLSLVYFVSFVINIFLFTWPIQQQNFRQ
jgi:hypothetical protein